MTLNLPVSAEANQLLTRNPMALLVGMLLDQQVPLEKAFSSPLDLARRLGHEPTAAELAEFDPDALAEVFSQRPALHRFPRAMAARTQDLARLIIEEYDGNPESVWATARSGGELVARLAKLPGFGGARRPQRGRIARRRDRGLRFQHGVRPAEPGRLTSQYLAFVEVAGIEPASPGVHLGLLRA